MPLNIAYVTSRLEPMIEWFFDSLALECGGDFSQLRIIVIDYYANPFGGNHAHHEARRLYVQGRADKAGIPSDSFEWMAPKSTPWQGKQRQTKDDWFNVANSRNTAICFADGDWIAFVDDLSVLMPGWLAQAAKACMYPKTITLGRYRKVLELEVESGRVVSFKPQLTPCGTRDMGEDSRQKHVGSLDRAKMNCPPEWHFGYVIGPTQGYLDVNGWVETESAGLGFEDVPTGINLARKGYSFRYDPLMLAYESQERHGVGPGMKKADYGESPKDKSHAVLENAKCGDGWAKNNFWNGMNLSQLRDHVHAKSSNPFPTPPPNVQEWFTGKRLWEL